MVTVAEESAPPARRRATLKYVITQNSAMNRYPPIRCSASIRELALAALTRDHDSSTSQTFTPPSRTNARPRAMLAEVVNMLNLLSVAAASPAAATLYRFRERVIPRRIQVWPQANAGILLEASLGEDAE